MLVALCPISNARVNMLQVTGGASSCVKACPSILLTITNRLRASSHKLTVHNYYAIIKTFSRASIL